MRYFLSLLLSLGVAESLLAMQQPGIPVAEKNPELNLALPTTENGTPQKGVEVSPQKKKWKELSAEEKKARIAEKKQKKGALTDEQKQERKKAKKQKRGALSDEKKQEKALKKGEKQGLKAEMNPEKHAEAKGMMAQQDPNVLSLPSQQDDLGVLSQKSVEQPRKDLQKNKIDNKNS